MTKAIIANPRILTEQDKLERKLKLTTSYFESPRDEEFPRLLQQQTQNFQLRLAGGGVKEVALVIMGASDSGKSCLLDHHLKKYPHLQPKLGDDGVLYSPVLFAEAPATSNSTKPFAVSMLASLGIPTSSRATEVELYAALKRILKRNKIECVVIDEMQHTVRGTKAAAIAKVQDVIKSLLQIDDWPIHFIFVGTDELAKLIQGDRQLANRCNVMRLHAVEHDSPNHMVFAERLLKSVVVDAAELTIGWESVDKMPPRLTKAADGALGGMIKLARLACIRTIDDDRTQVTVDDFAEAYRIKSGCRAEDNIFRSVDWAIISPARAVEDLTN